MRQVRLCDKLVWKEVQGKGHIDVFFVIRDSRIRGFQSAQPINFAVITLDEDPGINFLSNLPGRAPGDVPAGAPVEVIFEQTSNGQMTSGVEGGRQWLKRTG